MQEKYFLFFTRPFGYSPTAFWENMSQPVLLYYTENILFIWIFSYQPYKSFMAIQDEKNIEDNFLKNYLRILYTV